jgi:DNA-binding NarL/FixJ family response regulator
MLNAAMSMRRGWSPSAEPQLLPRTDKTCGAPAIAACSAPSSCLGNAGGALAYLQPPEPSAAREFWHFPIYHDLLVNSVEALVGVGEIEAAARLASVLDERARKLDNPWERATRARCRGLIFGAQGEFDDALKAFEAALDEREQLETPLDGARTLLALGRLQRRIGHKRAGRASLDAAIDTFDALGAPLWAEQARRELGRISGRAPSGDTLTPTEQRVAELVAEGLSNKKIAAALVVTVKAVEANLTRIYSKLGLHSRTELTRLLHGRRVASTEADGGVDRHRGQP